MTVGGCTEVLACRLCGEPLPPPWLDLGPQPAANGLCPTRKAALAAPRYPMAVTRCATCESVQLTHDVPPEVLFTEYPYRTGASASFRAHFDELAEELTRRWDPRYARTVAFDAGGNDGTLSVALQRRGWWAAVNVEPGGGPARASREADVLTMQAWWNQETVGHLVRRYGRAHVVTACNVFAHTADLRGFLSAVRMALLPGGYFVCEVYYLPNLLRDGAFDALCYHEHIFSHHLRPLVGLLESEGFVVRQVGDIPTHGGSIRIWAWWPDVGTAISPLPLPVVVARLDQEAAAGLGDPATYVTFAERAKVAMVMLARTVRAFRAEDLRVVGYTSPAKASVQLCAAGLMDADVEYVVDDAPSKQGKWIPGAGVPVVSSARMDEAPPDVAVVFSWNLVSEVLPKLPASVRRVIVPVPDVRVIER